MSDLLPYLNTAVLFCIGVVVVMRVNGAVIRFEKALDRLQERFQALDKRVVVLETESKFRRETT